MELQRIRVLCVDDNHLVADALKTKLRLAGGFEWLGQVTEATGLVELADRIKPDIILLDIDMPGEDPFDVLEALTNECPETRVVMFSGHVRGDLIDKAVEAGAWGYISKNDGTESIVSSLHRVAEGEFVIGEEAEAEFRRS
jgi:DNA-binding NarL/FixJ family response regulator